MKCSLLCVDLVSSGEGLVMEVENEEEDEGEEERM